MTPEQIAQLIADVEAVPPYARLDLTASKSAAFIALTKGEWARIKAELERLVKSRDAAQREADRFAAEADTAEAKNAPLRAAVAGVADDYMTSEVHHPGYVLIPTAKFEQLRAVAE